MGKCKVRVHKLTLAPGSLGSSIAGERAEEQDDEEECLHDREHLHNALEVLITSSSSRKVHPHIHGVVNKIDGHFWASAVNQRPTRRTIPWSTT
jgi:hypothetical protein